MPFAIKIEVICWSEPLQNARSSHHRDWAVLERKSLPGTTNIKITKKRLSGLFEASRCPLTLHQPTRSPRSLWSGEARSIFFFEKKMDLGQQMTSIFKKQIHCLVIQMTFRNAFTITLEGVGCETASYTENSRHLPLWILWCTPLPEIIDSHF